jgi:nicotinic acid phosphoribosyltransferase
LLTLFLEKDVEKSALFFKTHNSSLNPNDAKQKEFPFPEDLFNQFIEENDGYFPVTIESLPEGSVIYPHTPVYQITAKGKYSRLVTYLETLLTMIWYPCTVATLSRRCKDIILRAFFETVDADSPVKVESRMRDFGFRACTSVEQSVIGGCAHLLNFDGTATMSAAYYAQFELNNGIPVANSVAGILFRIRNTFNDVFSVRN